MIDWAGIFTYQEKAPLIFTRFFFWGFFAVVLAIYSIIHKERSLRNAYLFLVSLFFYYKSSGLFVCILLFSTVSDYVLALAIAHAHPGLKKKLWLALSLSVNLLLLCYFKYAHFLIDNINAAFGTHFHEVNYFAQLANWGFGSGLVVDRILLPVGISFFTFQAISYAMDVYRGHVQPVRNILDYGFFVSFFPQLVAGPITRAADFIPQVYKEFSLTRAQFGLAVFWILNGLAKKMLIGDYIAVNFIDRVFGDPSRFTGFENVLALYGYSLQVYCDFSGYTDIAIGVALLMGFRLPTNFNSPYKARNVGDFWKRWHMSLSTWLRDYLYIPMGGNRSGSVFSWIMLGFIGAAFTLLTGWLWMPLTLLGLVGVSIIAVRVSPSLNTVVTTNLNLMITMLMGGLWHGASWMFVIWGGLNGLGLVIYKFWKRISPWEQSKSWVAHAWVVFFTLTFISFTRIWFRSNSLETASSFLHQVTHNFGWNVATDVLWGFRSVFVVMLVGYVIHWLPERIKQNYRERFAALPLWGMALFSAATVFVIYQTVTAEMVPFIYFQF